MICEATQIFLNKKLENDWFKQTYQLIETEHSGFTSAPPKSPPAPLLPEVWQKQVSSSSSLHNDHTHTLRLAVECVCVSGIITGGIGGEEEEVLSCEASLL